jgi:hypothetical protein
MDNARYLCHPDGGLPSFAPGQQSMQEQFSENQTVLPILRLARRQALPLPYRSIVRSGKGEVRNGSFGIPEKEPT